jgi:chemotaxis protein methyltransferase CheR
VEALHRSILPELIANHRANRLLRIWCAACSTGEEPYTVAVLLHRLLPDIARWNISILGTDISKHSLAKARRGRYREWSFRRTEPAMKERFFQPVEGELEVVPEIRRMVTFGYLNQAEDAYPSLETNTNALDLVLCRNLAIYLPDEVIRMMAERFYRCLVPGGYLIVGASETNGNTYGKFETVSLPGAVVYRRATTAVPDTERPRPPRAMPKPPALPRASVPVMVGSREPPPLQTTSAGTATGSLLAEGIALLEEGRSVEALTSLGECVSRDADLAPAALWRMARAHANLGDLSQARLCCLNAIKLSPLLVDAYYTLALIHQETGEIDDAFANLRKTLYIEKDYVLANFAMANLLEQQGRHRYAVRYRATAARQVAKLPADLPVPGSDGLTGGRLMAMLQALSTVREER